MTIDCKGHLIDLATPRVMGILNLTPDSFYDGGRFTNEAAILSQAEKMISEGATFIDLGAYSSKPGANIISEDEENKRLLPIIDLLLSHFPNVLLSIDTFRSQVADQALSLGAAIINDISAGKQDEQMLPIIAKHQVPFIMMHMRGTPQNMQSKTQYDNLLVDILQYFSERLAAARALGIVDLVIDPGFGFAKTMAQNYELLSKLDLFQNLNVPVLAGLSRKSMIYKALEITPEQALNGTTALHMVALSKGANILRAHDVKEAVACITLAEKVPNFTQTPTDWIF